MNIEFLRHLHLCSEYNKLPIRVLRGQIKSCKSK